MHKTTRITLQWLLSLMLVFFMVPQGALFAAAAGDSALFSDDFSSQKSEWNTAGGKWSVKDGQLEADGMPTSDSPQPESKYDWVDGLGTDLIVMADVTPQDISNPDHRIGLSAHVKGGAGDTKWNLIFHNGKLTMLEEGVAWKREIPFEYEAGKTYRFKMSVVNGVMNGKVWLSGAPEPAEWMISDSFAGQMSEDGVGLYAGNGKASFDNFIVQSAPSFQIQSLQPGNIFTLGEQTGFGMHLSVKSSGTTSFDISSIVKDRAGNVVFQNNAEASVTVDQSYDGQLTIPDLQKGYYTADFKLTKGTENVQTVHTTLAVVDPAPNIAAADSPFGVGSSGAFMGERFDEKEADQRYAILEKMGVKWLREELFWDSLRPDPNQPYKWERFNYSVEKAREHKLSIMGIIDYFSNWSKPYGDGKNTEMDQAIANFAQYASDVVQYYKPNGTLAQQKGWTDGYGITAWEVWNEPPTFWSGTAEQFGQLVKAASAAIRKADPNATVIVTNAGEDFDQKVFDIAGAASYDNLAIHLYPGPIGPEKGNFAEQTQQTRKFLDRNSLTKAGIWVTEFGWDTFQVSEQDQAAYLVRANTELLAAGAQRNFAFTFNYGSEPPGWGLVHEDKTPKPSFAAYAEMTHELSGLKPVQSLSLGSALRGHVFSNGTKHTALVWSIEEPGTMQVNASNVQAVDMMGKPIGQSNAGVLTVPLTQEPVYLVTEHGTADQLGNAVKTAKVSGIAPLGIRIDQLSKLPTQLPPLQLTVSNRTNEVQNGKLQVTLPQGWSAVNNSLSFGPLQPGQQQQISFDLTQVVTHADNRYPIEARTTAADGTPIKGQTILSVLGSVYGTPNIDGDLSDWSGALGVNIDKPEQIVGIPNWSGQDLSATLYTMWDDQYLYFGARVNDNAHVQNQTGSDIWMSDSIQLYFDTLNDKSKYPAPDDQDLGLAYNPSAGPQVFRWTGGAYQGNVPSVKFAAKSPAQGQLVYEAAIPLSELQMTVQSGKTFGFDALINDDDGSGRKGWAWWSPGIGNAWDPSQWDTWTAIRSMELASIRLMAQQDHHDDQHTDHTFTANLNSPKLQLAVTNNGLEQIKLIINDKTVKLIAQKDKEQKDNDKSNGKQGINLKGDSVVDLSAYAVAGNNTIQVTTESGDGEALLRFISQ